MVTEGLRTVFKREWDCRYKATLREWKDVPQNGQDFKNLESPATRERNVKPLTTMVNGNRAEWDCTMLFYGILYSDCIGSSLNPLIRSSVNDLRKFRNEDFAHLPQGNLTKLQFQNAVGNVLVSFKTLGLSDVKIKELTNQTSFPTSELTKVLQQVKDLKDEIKEKERELKEKADNLEETEKRRKVLEEQLQHKAPLFCVLPPKPSHHVAGRGREVIDIDQKLERLKEANENCLSYLYISGNPGSGKSQLAALVAEKWFEKKTSDSSVKTFVMTLNAQNFDSLFESYHSLARYLKCPEDALRDIMKDRDMDSKKKIANIKSLITTKVNLYSTWLLIVDNVVRLNEISRYLPETGNSNWCKGQVLITSQDTAAIPSNTWSINHISVSEGMMLSDSLSLLASLSGIADDDTAKEVAEALDYQPLALASAATFVRLVRESKSPFFGWKDYLQKLSEGQRAKTEAFLADRNPSYPNSMTTAISLAVDSVMSTDRILNHAFHFISLCAQQPLNLELLINYVLNIEKESDGSAGNELDDADIIGLRIQESSLILIERDESSFFVRVHQVVKDAIQKKLTENCSEIVNFEVLSEVITSFYQFTIRKRLNDEHFATKSCHLIPHLKCLITEIEKHISQVRKSDTLRMKCFPHYFLILGKICYCHWYCDLAKTFGIVALNFTHSDDVFEGNATQANDELGNMEQAEECYERHHAIFRKKPGSQPVDVANCLRFLGSVLQRQGEPGQAKEYFERALAIYQESLGSRHVNVASTFNNLGDVLRYQGDLEEAKEYFERALDIYQKSLGPRHVNVASTFNNLGNVLRYKGDLEQAKEYFERALAIFQESLGSRHVNVASTFNNLGAVLLEKGDLEQAKEYFERALAIYQKSLGSRHVKVASTFNNLGDVLRDKGDLGQAKEYFKRALAIYQESLGSRHVNVASTFNNLGDVLRYQGDLEQAKEYFERALPIYQKSLGPRHVNVAFTFNNLGTVLRDKGDLGQAKEYFERALPIYQESLGSRHVMVAFTFNNLGNVLRDKGDLEQAKEYFERALPIYLLFTRKVLVLGMSRSHLRLTIWLLCFVTKVTWNKRKSILSGLLQFSRKLLVLGMSMSHLRLTIWVLCFVKKVTWNKRKSILSGLLQFSRKVLVLGMSMSHLRLTIWVMCFVTKVTWNKRKSILSGLLLFTRKVLVLSMSMSHLRLTIWVLCFVKKVTWDKRKSILSGLLLFTRRVLVLGMSMSHLRLTIWVMCFVTKVTWNKRKSILSGLFLFTRKVLVLGMSMSHLRLTIWVLCFVTKVTWNKRKSILSGLFLFTRKVLALGMSWSHLRLTIWVLCFVTKVTWNKRKSILSGLLQFTRNVLVLCMSMSHLRLTIWVLCFVTKVTWDKRKSILSGLLLFTRKVLVLGMSM